ncbi:MAG: hypothetical protein JXR86_17625 [Spirochaetales bacterium]|nr:hypothetical protein [Spirochaetales bacterium]
MDGDEWVSIVPSIDADENGNKGPDGLQPLTEDLIDLILSDLPESAGAPDEFSDIIESPGSDFYLSDNSELDAYVVEPDKQITSAEEAEIQLEPIVEVQQTAQANPSAAQEENPALPEMEVPPLIIVESPEDRDYYRSETVYSLSVFDDENRTGWSRIEKLYWTGSDRIDRELHIDEKGHTEFVIDSSGLSGPLIVKITALKDNGLSSEVIVELKEDLRGPSIVLETPAANQSVGDEIEIRGSLAPAADNAVPVEEISVLKLIPPGFEKPVYILFESDGSFHYSLKDFQLEGTGFLTLEAIDKNGHSSRLNVPLVSKAPDIVDDSPPLVKILSPEPDSLYYSQLDVRGEVYNNSEDRKADRIKDLTWSIGGSEGQNRIEFQNDGSFRFRISTVDMNRDLQILFRALGTNDLTGSVILPVKNDKKGPEITLASPVENQYFNNVLKVQGKVEDYVGSSNEVKSLYWSVSSRSDERNLIFFEDDGSFDFDINTNSLNGKVVFRISAADLNNNISDLSIPLNDGKKPPVIILNKPTSEESYGAGIRISGKISDPYAWNPGFGGMEDLMIRLEPSGPVSEGQIISRRLPLSADGSFDSILPVTGQSGNQRLNITAKAKNGNSSEISMILSQSEYAIPDFSVEQGDRSLVLSWTELPFIESYSLSLSSDGNGRVFENIHSPLVLRGLENGALYGCELSGIKDRDIIKSPQLYSIPMNDSILEPYALSEFGFIEISWLPVKGSSAYKVLRADESGSYRDISGKVEDSRFIDRSGVFGKNYSYKVVPFGYEQISSYGVDGHLLSEPPVRLTAQGGLASIHPEALVLSGGYAYVVSPADGFYIIDVSDPARLGIRGFLMIEGGTDVALLGDYALVTAGADGFYLISILEPAEPRLVSYRKTTDARAVDCSGDFVFIADGEKGLKIYSLSNLQRPPRISYDETYPAYDVFVGKSHLYMASGESGLVLVDISDPYYPQVAGHFEGIPVYSIIIEGDYAYVASWSSGVSILDISDRDNITLCSTYKTENARHLTLKDNHLYIADGEGGLLDVDVTDPYRPVTFESMDLTFVSSVDSRDNLLVVADRKGLRTVETFQYGQSFLIGELKTEGNASSVSVGDGLLYVADHSGGLVIIDSSDPADISEQDIIHVIPTEYAESLFISGDRLYLADGSGGVRIFAIRDEELIPLETIEVDGQVRAVRESQGTLYAAAGRGGILGKTLLESQPLEADDRRTVFSPDWIIETRDARDIEPIGSFLYCADRQSGLVVFKNERGATPERIREIELPGALALTGSEERLFVAHSEGVSLFDLSDPAYPEKVEFLSSPFVEDILILGSILYIAEGHAGLSVYDVKEDGTFVKVSECPDVFADSIAVEGDYAFVADSTGVNVVRIYIPDWIRNP